MFKNFNINKYLKQKPRSNNSFDTLQEVKDLTKIPINKKFIKDNDNIEDVFTNDLDLSNEGSQNDVDGTWGSYKIQEGEEHLFLINRRNGKKYKFDVTEVN